MIGTGAYGRLPVMKEVKLEAERRHVELVIVPTSEAIFRFRLMERGQRKRHSPCDLLGSPQEYSHHQASQIVREGV